MRDKFLHVAAGAVIAGSAAWFGYPVAGVVLAAVAGVAKEAWDMRGNGTPELADFIATLVGAVFMVFAICFASF
jgi:uncharacterized membrane protein YeaQ/YmgE (transglycosylase-associated protein family)